MPISFSLILRRAPRIWGNIPEAEYVGLELEANAYINDYLTGYFGLGLTDSKITDAG